MEKTHRRALPSPVPVKRSNLTALILERLRDYVIDHRFAAGDRLPPERVLAARLDVSRPSLRRALDWLDQRGALRRVQGRGTFLQTRFLPVFDKHIGGGRPLEADPDELIEACAALAASMIRLAAARVSSRDLRQLRTQLATACIETDEDWREHELRFHRSLANISGNSILAAALESLLSQAIESWTFRPESNRLGHHHAIVEALSNGDVDTAATRLKHCLCRHHSRGG